ncbi:hypothetical protein Forpi1262_v008054 [Fusarium oxysporum f. sp. raphani]|uniref:Uncharacterized protein n=1 Tax=Fusarium oxysporum f. sp. raphani TaxID=96318 RepID=A0A8J5UE47_FUSOX|nr:hypothetical protein Forpi1262_v008054 [Fusarium oxysporum f. sp. raphani]
MSATTNLSQVMFQALTKSYPIHNLTSTQQQNTKISSIDAMSSRQYNTTFWLLISTHGLDHPAKHARLAQSVERETLKSSQSQGCGFDPRIGLFL